MNRGQALQSAFKGRSNEYRVRETAIERCDVTIQDQPDKTECRFIVKMVSKHGTSKQKMPRVTFAQTIDHRNDKDLSLDIRVG